MKPSLTFYTNIPSPYNINFFEALSVHFELKVVYYSAIEKDRQWTLVEGADTYRKTCLDNNKLALLVQKKKTDFHFSNSIIMEAFTDKSSFVVVGGNYYIPNTLVVLAVAKLRGKKILWYGERLFPTASKIRFIIKKILLLPLRICCKRVLCVGKTAAGSYRLHGIDKPMDIIPYNIDSSRYDKEHLQDMRVRMLKQELNANGKMIILTSGSLIFRKGMDIAIESFIALPDELKNKCELWIMGDGELRDSLQSTANNHSNIKFLGFKEQDEIPFYYAAADVFLFCSRYDGWGVVINEAISSGLPVVVSDAVVASELIHEGKGGYVCASESVAWFQAALEKILRDRELRNSMGVYNKLQSLQWNSNAMALKLSKICEHF